MDDLHAATFSKQFSICTLFDRIHHFQPFETLSSLLRQYTLLVSFYFNSHEYLAFSFFFLVPFHLPDLSMLENSRNILPRMSSSLYTPYFDVCIYSHDLYADSSKICILSLDLFPKLFCISHCFLKLTIKLSNRHLNTYKIEVCSFFSKLPAAFPIS